VKIHDNGLMTEILFMRAPIKGKVFFLVQNKQKRFFVMRLDLIESILACGYSGLTLTESEIVA